MLTRESRVPRTTKSRGPYNTKKSRVPHNTKKSRAPHNTKKSRGPRNTKKSRAPYKTKKSHVPYRLKKNIKTEVPECDCFPPDKIPAEPGSFYTHLGTAASLPELRQDLENRVGFTGDAIRIEKVNNSQF